MTKQGQCLTRASTGNIVVLGILAAGVFVYVNYQRQQGQGRTVKPQTALKQST